MAVAVMDVMPKTHPLLIKRIGTTLLDHAPGALTVFPIVKLAKVDLDTPYRDNRNYLVCFHNNASYNGG